MAIGADTAVIKGFLPQEKALVSGQPRKGWMGNNTGSQVLDAGASEPPCIDWHIRGHAAVCDKHHWSVGQVS